MQYDDYTPREEPLSPGEWVQGERTRLRGTFNNIILHIHPATVPSAALRFTYTWGLGGMATVLTCLLIFTGVLLMFRYDAEVDRAYPSILAIETEVFMGSFVRAVHHWSANLLVVVTFLHLVRVFLTGGYKGRRAMNWWVGIALLVLVLTANFTGYLLPWDQLAYWAITVSTTLISYIPQIGAALSEMILGGPEVGQIALRNFYALHVAVIPVVMAISLSYHFWKVRKCGGITQPVGATEQKVDRKSTVPHLLNREVAAGSLLVTVVTLFSMAFPAPLEEMANPAHSPNPAKAAWYFLGLQELLLHMHALAAILLVGAILAGMILLPKWDRSSLTVGTYFRSKTGRHAAVFGALLSLNIIPLLILMDEYWLDLPGWLPDWPVLISTGLVPLAASLLGIALIYLLARAALKSTHEEALVAVFIFLITSLVILTVTGIYFRGPNMALTLPF